MKKTRSDNIFMIINTIFLLLMIFVIIYPLYFCVMASVSEPYAVASGQLTLWPVGFTLEGYTNVFKNTSIWNGYVMSIFYTAAGTAFSLLLTIPAAYVLSKKKLPGRTAISTFFLFTMFFGGGLVPFYVLVKDLGLYNNILTLIVLSGMSVYYMVITRVYFETSIPESLYEAAYIDGASEFYSFFRVALPLSAPIIAVMALFYGASNWNSYFNALIFLSDKKLFPLQLVLRGILILNQNALSSIDFKTADIEMLKNKARLAYMAEAIKYSLIFVSAAPMLIAYPFVQKYFVKGVLIGSLKG